MTAQPTSLERAIRAEVGDEDTVLGFAASAEQLDLLRGEDAKLPGNVFRLVRSGEAERRGPGRPEGSVNRRSKDLAKLVVHQHGDPVMAMASLYSRPLDQLIELVLIADSTAEREERLLGLIDKAEDMISSVMKALAAGTIFVGAKGGAISSSTIDALIEKIGDMLERVFDAAKALKMKPGDLAIKALNLQLAAAKATAEYVHSKKPVEVVATHRSDGVIVAPPVAPGMSIEAKGDLMRLAADGVVKMLESGRIDPRRLGEYQFKDGQFVDAEFDEVDDGDGEPA